jgi:hypothetical protein
MKYLKSFENMGLYRENVKGVIQKDGVLADDGKLYNHAVRGTDEEGYPEILIHAREIGGSGSFARQSVKLFIGMIVRFTISPTGYGYNYEIKKEDNK